MTQQYPIEVLLQEPPPCPETLSDLKDCLDQWPRQADGNPSAICEATQQEYTECYVSMLARPDDKAVIERVATARMMEKIIAVLNHKRDAMIYWRKRLEWKIEPQDGNWLAVKAYCRLAAGEEKDHDENAQTTKA